MPRQRFHGFDDAFAYLRRFTDYERMAGPKYGPKGYNLDRTRALLAVVGDPHLRLKVVHVTGTKGKGSTAMMVAAILRALDLRVGLFTSPHLVHVRERIQVDSRPIPPAAFAARMNEMGPYLDAARLGDTVAKIAVEKAGILKRGVPAVTAATDAGALAVIQARARELGCPLRRVGREIEARLAVLLERP